MACFPDSPQHKVIPQKSVSSSIPRAVYNTTLQFLDFIVAENVFRGIWRVWRKKKKKREKSHFICLQESNAWAHMVLLKVTGAFDSFFEKEAELLPVLKGLLKKKYNCFSF